jgi:uncharacterized HAD superfamily protein
MKIAFDLDDILAEFNQAWALFHNKKYGTNLTYGDFTDFDYTKFINITKEEAAFRIFEFYKTDEGKNLKVVEGALEIVNKLKKNHELCVLTSRDVSIKDMTNNWVKKNFGNLFDEIYLTSQLTLAGLNHKVTKGDFCIKYGIDLLVEDAPVHAQNASDMGIKVALVEKTWNKSFTYTNKNLYRIKQYDELLKICE